jgi:hypothetical protein
MPFIAAYQKWSGTSVKAVGTVYPKDISHAIEFRLPSRESTCKLLRDLPYQLLFHNYLGNAYSMSNHSSRISLSSVIAS